MSLKLFLRMFLLIVYASDICVKSNKSMCKLGCSKNSKMSYFVWVLWKSIFSCSEEVAQCKVVRFPWSFRCWFNSLASIKAWKWIVMFFHPLNQLMTQLRITGSGVQLYHAIFIDIMLYQLKVHAGMELNKR